MKQNSHSKEKFLGFLGYENYITCIGGGKEEEEELLD